MLLAFIGIVLLVFYTLYIYWVHKLWRNIPTIEIDSDYKPTTRIAVIIPVRNEALHIRHCIDSLLNNNYPEDLFELIIINDHSEDDTVSIVEGIDDKRIRLLHLCDYLKSDTINAYKKLALQYGIVSTSNQLIISNDGDSFVPINYLRTISFYYEQHQPKMITGPVLFDFSNNIIEDFQVFDMMTMMGISAAGISAQKYFIANGANLIFEREAYLSLEPIKATDKASGDDMFLVQSMAAKYPGSVHFLKSKELIVTTALTKGIKAFLEQRKRWASKSKQYKEHNIKILMVFVFVVNVFIPFLFIIGIYCSNQFLIIISLFLFLYKFIIDRQYVKGLSIFFDRKPLIKKFIFSYILYYAYILFTGIMGLSASKYSWKDRRVN